MTLTKEPAVAGASDSLLLELRALSVGREGRVLIAPMDLDFPAGSFTAVLGPSGTGKTSFLFTLAGMLKPASGTMVIRKGTMQSLPATEYRRRLGLVFQHFRLTPNETVATNILCGTLGRHSWCRTLLGFPPEARQKASRLLERVELAGFEEVPVSRISGGEKQRIAMARALMQEPDWLIADEPVSHLDHALAGRMLSFLKAESRRTNMTVICVLHDAGLAREHADRILTFPGDQKWQMDFPGL
jgi:phosphonate transport system ATP-binding protein